MSVIGEFTIPAEGFVLESALSTVPAVTLEADRLASHSTMEVLPFVWATDANLDDVQRALEDDPDVIEVTVAERTDDQALYRMEWSHDFRDLINEVVDHHAVILEATAGDGEWTLKLRFAEEDMVSEFQTHFRERGHHFEVHQLTRPSEPRQREFGLTEEQYEALVLAAEEGYFRVPRTTSVEELGETLGVSANSVSQRLRRGSEALVGNALTISGDGSD